MEEWPGSTLHLPLPRRDQPCPPSQRIKVEKMENPDLAESGAHWKKLWPLIWVFTSLPSLTREGGMGFSTGRGSISWNKKVQPAPLLPSFEAPHPAASHLHLCCRSSSKEESSQRRSEGPNLLAFQPQPKPARGTSGEPLLEEVIQKPRWPGGPP